MRAARAGPALVVAASLFGCGIAPIQAGRTGPGPPRTHVFVGAHGRPRAWSGGVCPLTRRHEHLYPPVPPAAFVDDDGAWRDTRALQDFDGPHPWKGQRCSQPGWHQHV